MTGTIRQQIIEELKKKPMSAFGLALTLGSAHKAMENHLEHIAKSVGPAFEMIPAECHSCGFKFSKRDRMTKPTKCPSCKSEDISPPLFYIS